ncbi:MAG: acyltransferase [Prevotellaceae bacterium]|jgi:surface polysaccharide O-acyltransferase-like enzyme|nr:acyltransferase [Prevotellaceae bacterium]
MKRESNIELLRIVAMFMIVVHHYCVNSGLTQLFDYNNITGNTLLVQFMSFGGKVGVNIFFIISGFFMINSSTFKWEKVVKIIFQILFYGIVVMAFLMFLGYSYSIKTIIEPLLMPFIHTSSFISAYLFVYILTSVINKMLKAITEKEFLFLIAVLIFYFSILSIYPLIDTWNYFGWAFTCYVVGAYLSMYGKKHKFYNSLKISSICGLGGVLIIWISMLVYDFIGVKYLHTINWRFFMADANKITVFLVAIFMFMSFKNIKVKYNKVINLVATSCFGVLLIHANSDMMRQWLWKDFLHNTEWFQSSYLWLHMLLSCVGIYIVCTIIDICRIKFIEKPLFDRFRK